MQLSGALDNVIVAPGLAGVQPPASRYDHALRLRRRCLVPEKHFYIARPVREINP
jgi:hypothetical protein